MSLERPPGALVPSRRYAGFWIRGVASIIDDVLLTIGSLGLTYLTLFLIFSILRPAPTFGEAFTGGFIQTINLAAMVALSIPYYVLFHWKYGATPGKLILKIRVIRDIDDGSLSLGRSTARLFAQIPSIATFGAGYLMAAWNPKKQGIHDLIAGTVSIRLDSEFGNRG